MSHKTNRILLLFAHPSQSQSEVNLPLFQASAKVEGVTAVDLYAEYPTNRINIDREQERLLAHDTLIFQFPMYWYSTPPILKEWQDLVLEYGFAYGAGGTALHGKSFMCSFTAGGPEVAYGKGGLNNFTVRELLRPLEQTAMLTGMHFHPPFALFGARTALEENRLDVHIQQWVKVLEMLKTTSFNTADFEGYDTFNQWYDKNNEQRSS
ncbi:MAG: NAD(P)H-dependent oxidoreductase [Pseudomonadota bacterium]